MSEPLLVEIIAYAPTAYYQCTHCEIAWREMGNSNHVQKEQMESSLPEDLAREYLAVSDWVREIFRLHSERVIVKVIDAASLEGLLKSLRYNTRRYPAIIINRKDRFIGKKALAEASEVINRLKDDQAIIQAANNSKGGT